MNYFTSIKRGASGYFSVSVDANVTSFRYTFVAIGLHNSNHEV